MPNPTLIYFEGRGRAELIRLILSEAGVEWNEHPVDEGTPPRNGRPTDFEALKAQGQLPFDAVPVWEEPDGFRLAQSLAIANHLARTHGLHGKTEREHAQVEQALGGFDDARADLRKIATAEDSEVKGLRDWVIGTSAPRWLGHFEKLLAANGGGKGFLVGDSLTSADLALWYLVELYEANGFGAPLAKAPLVAAHAKRIGARPRLSAYVASKKRPAFEALPS